MPEKTVVNRRQFLGSTAGAGIALSATAKSVRGAVGANEKVATGIIGTGGMGRHHINSFKAQPDVKFLALCDIYEGNVAEGLKAMGEEVKVHHDYHELLDRKDIDAVIIASPEHWHHDMLIDALDRNKDVYCEKPMSWSIEQGANMVKAVRKTDRIVQIGMQRRSSPLVWQAKEIIDSGQLGQVHLVRAEWYWKMGSIQNNNRPLTSKMDWERFCGPAGKQEFEPVKVRNWRYFWPFSGGNVTDQGTHLIDVVQWFMNADQPLSAIQFGEVYHLQPAETPDTFCATLEYPNFMATWTLGYTTNTWRDGWSIVFQGMNRSLELSEAGYRVFDEKSDWSRGLPMPVKADLPGGVTRTEPHTRNFLDCIKSRNQPNATVEVGHRAVRSLHLANQAFHKNARVKLGADGQTVTT
jgi:predicted dehydrogenase